MSSHLSQSSEEPSDDRWHTFEDVLQRLHQAGIYLHPHQLAEFFLAHGLPVDPQYVPAYLQDRAAIVNENYQGDMARLEEISEQSWYIALLERGL